MQKPVTHEGTVTGKKKTEQNQEPNSHVCIFQLILPIIAQLFPYRELQWELIIKVKFNAFKAGGCRETKTETHKAPTYLISYPLAQGLYLQTEISNVTFGVTGDLKALALLFSFPQVTQHHHSRPAPKKRKQ